jgi:NAD(P)-dependent dehydrogenase (short-subunit alcohol dehydrogenase family)
MRGLAGKVAIVTGAGSGIGEACANRLAEEKVKVVVADKNESTANAVAMAIERAGGIAIPIKVNVAVESEIASLIAETVREFGKLDILHNNRRPVIAVFGDPLASTSSNYELLLYEERGNVS